MNKGARSPERDEVPLEDESLDTAQEAIPVPYIAGTRRIALRWISPALDMITREAPDDVGKK